MSRRYSGTEKGLFYIGLRGISIVAGRFDILTGVVTEYYDDPLTCGSLYPETTVTADGSLVCITEGWNEFQKLVLTRPGHRTVVKALDHPGSDWLRSRMGECSSVSWLSSDGLDIQGYLCRPSQARERKTLILNVHGGPVWTLRNKWQLASPIVALLVSLGYSVLNANPRGSTGRGQAFCERVLGDLGSKDADDLLSGIQAMIKQGNADKGRVGIMGVSYGGYMATWIPTQSDILAASVAIAPVTNWTSNHNLASISAFDEIFFGQSPYQPGGLYHQRSSINFAGRHPTPVLQITGARDTCVPPSQAMEYHNALCEAGVRSEVVNYPLEGHGIRQDAAHMDFCTRTVSWFAEYLRG